jgi:hypothetical protein
MSWCVGNRKRDKHMINVLMWWVSANFLSCSRTSWNFSSLRWSFWGHLNSVYFCEGFLQLPQYQEQANSDWVVSGVTSNSSIAQLWLDWLHFGWLMLFHAFPIFPYLSLTYFTSTFSCFQSFIAAIRLEDSATNLADRITSRSLSAGAQFFDKIWQRFKRLEEVRKVRQVCKVGQRNAVLNCSTQYLKGVHQRSVFSFWS